MHNILKCQDLLDRVYSSRILLESLEKSLRSYIFWEENQEVESLTLLYDSEGQMDLIKIELKSGQIFDYNSNEFQELKATIFSGYSYIQIDETIKALGPKRRANTPQELCIKNSFTGDFLDLWNLYLSSLAELQGLYRYDRGICLDDKNKNLVLERFKEENYKYFSKVYNTLSELAPSLDFELMSNTISETILRHYFYDINNSATKLEIKEIYDGAK